MRHMNLLSWIIFGTIVGIIANSLETHTSRNTMLGAVILATFGAILGGFLADLLFGTQTRGFDIASFIVAAGGALFLLSLGRAVRSS